MFIEVDKVFMFVGFVLNVEGFGLENIGVKFIECGVIDIDDYMCINVEGIYVIGDVIVKL